MFVYLSRGGEEILTTEIAEFTEKKARNSVFSVRSMVMSYGCFFPCKIIISYKAGPRSLALTFFKLISNSSSALKRK